MIRSDAWDGKTSTHALTLKVELMHEAEKQGIQHHFPPFIPLAARPCWRCPAGKALIHRRATPTFCPESRPAPLHVGVAPPAKSYPTVGPRQHFVRNPARRPSMLAPPRRQTLISPPGHANILSGRSPGAGPCWRCPAGKALCHRRVTPTFYPEGRSPPAHVGAAPPAKP